MIRKEGEKEQLWNVVVFTFCCLCFDILLPFSIQPHPPPHNHKWNDLTFRYFPLHFHCNPPLPKQGTVRGVEEEGHWLLEISKLGKYLQCDSSLPWCMGAKMAILVATFDTHFWDDIKMISDGTQRLLKTTLKYPVPLFWFLPAVQRHAQVMGRKMEEEELSFNFSNFNDFSNFSNFRLLWNWNLSKKIILI